MSWASSRLARSSEMYEEPLSDSSLGRWKPLALSSPATSSAFGGYHTADKSAGSSVSR